MQNLNSGVIHVPSIGPWSIYLYQSSLLTPFASLLYFSSYSNCASGFTEKGRKWSKHELLHVFTSTATYCIHTQTLPLWSGGTLCSPGAYSLLLNLFLVFFLQLIPFIPSCRIIFISMKLFYNRSFGAVFSCCIHPHLTARSFVIKFKVTATMPHFTQISHEPHEPCSFIKEFSNHYHSYSHDLRSDSHAFSFNLLAFTTDGDIWRQYEIII